jgi:hypothetical protein
MHLLNLSKRKVLIYSGLIFFIYSLIVGIAIQTFIVPHYFPQFDLGDGIVILDSSGFNGIAKSKSTEILNKGWHAWELRPDGQSPAGIASFFYVIMEANPISMLPFNALIHALSGSLLIWLLLHIFSWRASVFGASLFILNPQALQWVAAIHRDGIFILGNLLTLVCITWFIDELKNPNLKKIMTAFGCGIVGTSLVWVARPYFVQVITIFVVIGIVYISISFLINFYVKKVIKFNLYFITVLSCTLLLLSFQILVIKFHTSPSYELNAYATIESTSVIVDQNKLPFKPIESVESTESTESVESVESTKSVESDSFLVKQNILQNKNNNWISAEWLPDRIERKLYTIFITRMGAINTGGYTVVDREISLNNAFSFITYFPRALQLGLFSPLPHLWLEDASTPVMTLARKIIGVMTFIFYFFYLGLVMAILSRWKNMVMWVTLTFCMIGILIFSYSYPNIGTLLRFRYGFYMILIAIGASCIFEMASGIFKYRKLK